MASIEDFCKAMRWAAESNCVGYSQSDRWNLTKDDIFKDGAYNTDCSSLVITCLQYASFATGEATYTGNLSSNLCAHGWQRIKNDGNPQVGDILLNDNDHVAVWLGDCLAQASQDENGNLSGGERGDQTGQEVNLHEYYNYPWDCYLRYIGHVSTKRKRKKMEFIFQPNGEKRLQYYSNGKIYNLDNPDQVSVIQQCYRQCYGEEIPLFTLGSKGAPWATRLYEIVGKGV